MRSLLPVGCRYLGNAASNSFLHRPFCLWGLALRDIECEAVLDDVWNLAKCASVPKLAGIPPNPLGRLLSDYLFAYLQSYESRLPPDWPFCLRGLQICEDEPLPTVWLGSSKRVLPIELFDGAPITRARLTANNCISQFPALFYLLLRSEVASALLAWEQISKSLYTSKAKKVEKFGALLCKVSHTLPSVSYVVSASPSKSETPHPLFEEPPKVSHA